MGMLLPIGLNQELFLIRQLQILIKQDQLKMVMNVTKILTAQTMDVVSSQPTKQDQKHRMEMLSSVFRMVPILIVRSQCILIVLGNGIQDYWPILPSSVLLLLQILKKVEAMEEVAMVMEPVDILATRRPTPILVQLVTSTIHPM